MSPNDFAAPKPALQKFLKKLFIFFGFIL
jgi:hypothetical protein